MSKKYIDELCRIYGKRDIKQLAYLAYVYHFSELCNMNIDERWLLYEIVSRIPLLRWCVLGIKKKTDRPKQAA